jgi:glycosyltransferase involved in cell wall biosynthesis
MKSVDVLVAVRNEEKTINEFINKFNRLAPEGVIINLIFLEDGSTDGTVSLLRDLSKDSKKVNYISLDNKYGQYAALFFGLSISKAEAVITMDVDGGHPVETGIEMIIYYLKGYNLVQGHRITYKREKSYRTVMSNAYNFFFYVFAGINFFKQNVMFRLMDKPTKELFLQHKNWWHIFKTNFTTKDAIKTRYVEYSAPERESGESKYGFFRLFKLSFKSFFALLSFKRLIVINLFLTGLIYIAANYVSVILSILFLAGLLLINISFYVIINNYPIVKLKIIETSLQDIRR